MDLKASGSKRAYIAPQIIKLTVGEASARFETPGEQMSVGSNKRMKDEFRMQALVLTRDERVNKILGIIFSNFITIIQSCTTESEAQEKFSSQKFDAIVLDFDSFSDVFPSREKFQQNRANRHAVIFAIATGPERSRAVKYGASFIFEKPLEPAEIEQVLRAAYGLMLRDRREYFRLAVELPVSFRSETGTQLQGKTINVSRNGMAATIPSPLETGMLIHFKLRFDKTAEPLYGTAKVIWDDRHGKAGLSFQSYDLKSQAIFYEWLDNHFYNRFDLAER